MTGGVDKVYNDYRSIDNFIKEFNIDAYEIKYSGRYEDAFLFRIDSLNVKKGENKIIIDTYLSDFTMVRSETSFYVK